MSVRNAVPISSQRNGLSISPIIVFGTCGPARCAGIDLKTRFICLHASWRTSIDPFAVTPAASQSSPRSTALAASDQSFWNTQSRCNSCAAQRIALAHVADGSMLSEKDFWHRSEEEYFKNKPASRILIQVCLISDSIIAHFCRSNAHRLTFSTASTHRRHRDLDRQFGAPAINFANHLTA